MEDKDRKNETFTKNAGRKSLLFRPADCYKAVGTPDLKITPQ
ncbi:hypothetical protein PORCRE_1248 [Porphyromonas crevioricanis JCM 15906]|uniref:Uncharacterized protein n=1 Tax=Porphyromonas crevioricanis JCM 15906 TaxID=1305617 RepID=T1CR40_9PORP|nr:hypothetical protein PORCRE_1248 [Porphyromonas crevioricanis JCM 15906]GAD07816.1 hypothetical protein PORCAN_1444 [Porphyromonas crevioricanis JCM 13913]